MNDFNQMHALYHSDLAKQALAKRKLNYLVINEDFLSDLPSPIRSVMDRLKWDYGDRPWFVEAWEKYRKSVLDAGLGGKIKMPGAVFNEYFDKYELKELEKIYGNQDKSSCVAYHSDEYVEDYLMHYGIKGQKWGIRRYQNEDGTLTAEGMARYGVDKHGNMSEEGKKLFKKDNSERDDINARKGKRIGMAVGATVVAGTYATGKLLTKYGKGKAKTFGTKASSWAGKDGKNGQTRLSIGKVLLGAILAGAVTKGVIKRINKSKEEEREERQAHTQQYLDSIEYQRRIAKLKPKTVTE